MQHHSPFVVVGHLLLEGRFPKHKEGVRHAPRIGTRRNRGGGAQVGVLDLTTQSEQGRQCSVSSESSRLQGKKLPAYLHAGDAEFVALCVEWLAPLQQRRTRKRAWPLVLLLHPPDDDTHSTHPGQSASQCKSNFNTLHHTITGNRKGVLRSCNWGRHGTRIVRHADR